jgi:ribosomal protein L15
LTVSVSGASAAAVAAIEAAGGKVELLGATPAAIV